MLELAAADKIEVLVLVDNVTDNLSSVPDYVENEFPRLWKAGLRQLSGRCLCCAAHGLACAITASQGSTSRTLLFDTGRTTRCSSVTSNVCVSTWEASTGSYCHTATGTIAGPCSGLSR